MMPACCVSRTPPVVFHAVLADAADVAVSAQVVGTRRNLRADVPVRQCLCLVCFPTAFMIKSVPLPCVCSHCLHDKVSACSLCVFPLPS